MAQEGIKTLVGGIIGATIGFFLPIPGGAALGFSIGAALGAGFEDKTPIVGQRVTDTLVTGASFGDPIKICRGFTRVGGQIIWSTGLIEDKDKKKEGGGLFTSGTEVTTFKYFSSLAVLICEGTIIGIRKIWMDKQLVWNNSDTATAGDIELSNKLTKEGITVYVGSETQDPDPVIEAEVGTGLVNANRGMAYVVFNKLKLKQFGNRVPQIEFEVVKDTALDAAPNKVGDTLTTQRQGGAFGKLDDGTILTTTITSSGHPATHTVYRQGFDGAVLQTYTFTGLISGGGATERLCKNDPWFAVIASGSGGYSRLYYKGELIELIDYTGQTGPLGTYDYEMYDISASNNNLHIGNFYIVVAGNELGLIRYSAGANGEPSTNWDLTVAFADVFASADPATYLYTIWPDQTDGDVFWMARSGGGGSDPNYLTRWDTEFNLLNTWNANTTGMPTGNNFHAVNNFHARGNFMFKRTSIASFIDLYTFDYETDDSTWTLAGSVTTVTATWSGVVPLGNNMIMGLDEIVTLEDLINGSGENLSDVVSDLCLAVGYTAGQIDVTGLTGTVRGYTVNGPTTARQAIEGLQQAFFFDAAEMDDKLTFVMRGGASVTTLAAGDLGAHMDGQADIDAVPSERTSELELPRSVTINYFDVDANYEAGSQYARRIVTEANRETVVNSAVVQSADEAARAADVLLYNEHQNLEGMSITVNESFLKHTPTDPITIPVDGQNTLVRILEESYALEGMISYSVVPEHTPIYTQARSGSTSGATYDENIPQNGASQLAFLDIPILSRFDDGLIVYTGAAGYLTTWSGHELWKFSNDTSTYNQIASFVSEEEATTGVSTDALADHDHTTIDRTNTVNVRLSNSAMTLTSSTEAAVIADGAVNRAVLGPSGDYEIIQFITATLEGDGTYTLSGLLRGRRGTGYATDGHASSDLFVMLDPDQIITIPMPSGDIDTERTYKYPGFDQSIDEVDSYGFTYTGRSKLPLSPANVTAELSAGDWIINWIARNRLSVDLIDNVASSDDTELVGYTVDIMSGATVKRSTSITVGTETWTYTSAMQTTDFGGAQTDIDVIVYQDGTTLGEGHGLQWDTATATETITEPKAA